MHVEGGNTSELIKEWLGINAKLASLTAPIELPNQAIPTLPPVIDENFLPTHQVERFNYNED